RLGGVRRRGAGGSRRRRAAAVPARRSEERRVGKGGRGRGAGWQLNEDVGGVGGRAAMFSAGPAGTLTVVEARGELRAYLRATLLGVEQLTWWPSATCPCPGRCPSCAAR